MSEFIWVASYPKSGSTWMRFILSHLLFDVGGDAGKVREMVPNMHDWTGGLKYDWQGAHPVKTHLQQHDLPPRMHTRSAIYVIRNPLDMVDSAIGYIKPADDAEREDLINQFCVNGSIEPWGTTLGYGSWEDNIQSWTAESRDFPLLIMQYEDILDAPHDNIARVAEFLGADADDKKIDKVVEATSFKTMKGVEKSELAAGAKGVFTDERLFNKQDFAFMRAGKSGGYQNNLREGEITRLRARFSPVMEKLGYC